MPGTKTSSFGMSKRENHDSSGFYSSKLYENHDIKKIKDISENKINPKYVNKVITADGRNLDFIPDESVHLVVTSPPISIFVFFSYTKFCWLFC